MPANKKAPATGRSTAAASADDGPTFEEALERLETIVEELEGGSLTLEQSLTRYEEGIRLSRRLTQTLDQAEKRIERLVEEEGGPVTRPLEQDAGEQDVGEQDAGEQDAGKTEPGEAEPARGRRAPPGDEGELPF
jgi:exodeoxyribonuclease VII small subunit